MSADTIESLTIGQAREAIERGKEIEKIIGGAPVSPIPCSRPGKGFSAPQIIILDRGFVYVGDVTIDADWVTISNARNVRRWGNSKGLGELAKSGPLKDSVLDPAGTVRAPMRALIGLIECEASSWKK